ncbi:MAG: CHRD domain-containing protein [Bryobacteraceae bacterium]
MPRNICKGLCLMAVSSVLVADSNSNVKLRAAMSPYNEVPAVSTTGSGEAEVRVAKDGKSLEVAVTYENISGNPTQSHIHFAQKGVNGSIMLWLCGSATNPGPAGTPLCPASTSGSYSRTLTSAEVQAIAAQGIAANDIDAAVKALRLGRTYANLHTAKFPAGELRGQLGTGDERD